MLRWEKSDSDVVTLVKPEMNICKVVERGRQQTPETLRNRIYALKWWLVGCNII